MNKIKVTPYMPTELEVKKIDQNSAQVIAYPFENGFAITLAHPLRRLLFSSSVGYAPVALKIEGVSHEFDSVRGMLEDVAFFIMNLKNIRFKINDENSNKVTVNYSFSGPKELKGADLENSEISVVNPDAYLATLNEDAELNFSVIIEKGIGYVASEDIRDGIENDYIALDAFFTPVRKAVYEIEKVLVEDNPNYEKIVFTIETDGQIDPIDAFKNSIIAMNGQLSVFNKIMDTDFASDDEVQDETSEISKLLDNIDTLKLSVRSSNCLDRAGLKYIGELAIMSESELKAIKNLGKKSLDEIVEKMKEIGFPVGMEFDENTLNLLSKKIEELKSQDEEE
ncbi:MAG: DNA-directed RNA polymerase subunit alpha [Epsilonproteobacteria bacterium]|nr:DNA-directed RNA polymerase subunit alpha [Campylobacterota bacterium]